MMARRPITDFVALRLNYLTDKAWAVIERPSGAIALDRQGKLIVRLCEGEARDLAAFMTAAMRDEAIPFEPVSSLMAS